jgi:hypothetical protein
MAKLTWAELEDFIKNIDTEKLDDPVMIYDMSTGDEIFCDVIELKNEDETWSEFIGINLTEDVAVEN